MNIGPLSLFQRTNSPDTLNIASWHNPRSITWRWVLSRRKFRADEKRTGWLVSRHKTNIGSQTIVRIPRVCLIYFDTQQPMWKAARGNA